MRLYFLQPLCVYILFISNATILCMYAMYFMSLQIIVMSKLSQ